MNSFLRLQHTWFGGNETVWDVRSTELQTTGPVDFQTGNNPFEKISVQFLCVCVMPAVATSCNFFYCTQITFYLIKCFDFTSVICIFIYVDFVYFLFRVFFCL